MGSSNRGTVAQQEGDQKLEAYDLGFGIFSLFTSIRYHNVQVCNLS